MCFYIDKWNVEKANSKTHKLIEKTKKIWCGPLINITLLHPSVVHTISGNFPRPLLLQIRKANNKNAKKVPLCINERTNEHVWSFENARCTNFIITEKIGFGMFQPTTIPAGAFIVELSMSKFMKRSREYCEKETTTLLCDGIVW